MQKQLHPMFLEPTLDTSVQDTDLDSEESVGSTLPSIKVCNEVSNTLRRLDV